MQASKLINILKQKSQKINQKTLILKSSELIYFTISKIHQNLEAFHSTCCISSLFRSLFETFFQHFWLFSWSFGQARSLCLSLCISPTFHFHISLRKRLSWKHDSWFFISSRLTNDKKSAQRHSIFVSKKKRFSGFSNQGESRQR